MIWFSRGMKCVLVCCFIEPGQSKHTALIGGVADAGVFGLVAVVALAVLMVKFRKTQRLPNSKNDERVGHNNLAFKPEDDAKGKQSSA